jgi:hypothetical protein
VVNRRGELRKATIDRDWLCVTIRLFCDGERLSLCPRGHSFYRDFCFAEHEHAEKLRERFDREFIDPKDRPKWPASRR